MAGFTQGNFKTREAGADLSAAAKAWSLVKLNASGKVVSAAAATDAILGVLENCVVEGDNASVGLVNAAGTLKVRVGSASIAKDALITSDANGLAVTAATTTGVVVVGRALEAGAAGQVIEFLPFVKIY